MQLKLTRSQKSSGMLSKAVVFCLDARAELSAEERENMDRYKLGGLIIYNSEKSKRHLENTRAGLERGGTGFVSAAVSLAMAQLSLNITMDSLARGHHIECKDMVELLGAEEAVMEGCQNMRLYLETAATFDGREQVVEF